MPDEQPKEIGLSKEQKIGFILLLVFAVLAVGLGFLQIRNTMYGPFALNKSIPSSLKEQVNTPEALQYRDTDMDGLNDFDELYIYGTSAYLADTDSDGIGDKQEIDSGKNPSCAEGRNCSGIVNSAEWSSGATSSINITVPDPGAPPPDLSEALKDPRQIRQMLLQAGAEEKLLNQFSDADLVQLVDEMMMVTNTPMNQMINNMSGGAGAPAGF